MEKQLVSYQGKRCLLWRDEHGDLLTDATAHPIATRAGEDAWDILADEPVILQAPPPTPHNLPRYIEQFSAAQDRSAAGQKIAIRLKFSGVGDLISSLWPEVDQREIHQAMREIEDWLRRPTGADGPTHRLGPQNIYTGATSRSVLVECVAGKRHPLCGAVHELVHKGGAVSVVTHSDLTSALHECWTDVDIEAHASGVV